MVLCGGRGTSLRPLTDELPKPLVELKDNYTVLHKQLLDFASAGFSEVFLLTAYKADLIRKKFGDEHQGIKLIYVEESEPSGTLPAVREGLRHACDDVLIMNGDVVADVNLKRMASKHESSGFQATIFATRMTCPYGVVGLGDDRVRRFREKPLLDTYIHGGIYCLDGSIEIDELEGDNIERSLFSQLAEQGGLGFYLEDGRFWASLDTLRELNELRREYKERTDKPWGYEKVLISTEKYLTKELYIRSGYQTSYHRHPRKDETMYVLEGSGYVQFEDDKVQFRKGETVRIEPMVPHTIVALENTVLQEVSTPHLEDTERLKDFYTAR
jgi:NDP-sugar pyrophosphorylase family protein